jgi:hypothetical protein
VDQRNIRTKFHVREEGITRFDIVVKVFDLGEEAEWMPKGEVREAI